MINKYLISKDKELYRAFPDLIIFNNKMICVFAEMNLEKNISNICYTISNDKGLTWTERKKLQEKIDNNGRWDAPRICKMKDGNIIILAPWYKSKKIDPDHHDSHIYMWKCDSDLSKIEFIETTITGIVPDKILELEDCWIISTHEKNNNKRNTLIYFSYDKGLTWTDKKILANSDIYDLCETSICNIDNTLVALMRENSNQGIDALKIISYDNGKTWSEIYRMPIPACHRPVITKLLSDNYLITYRFDQGKSFGMHGQNILGCICTKDGLLETDRDKIKTRIFPIDYDRSKDCNCGYTGVVQFEDGMIYIVSYIVDDNPVGQIRGYSFYEKDIIL